MIIIPYYKQKNAYFCGPAVMQMILAYYGIRTTQTALARRMRTNTRRGTTYRMMIATARRYGLRLTTNRRGTLRQLKRESSLYPTCVEYAERDNNEAHYAIIKVVQKDRIILYDPYFGKDYILPRSEFLARWRDAWGTQGIRFRWMMSIRPA
ncbi:MAG: cysteine peptidase family C39 domain-containing protein [Patescibacteria group bacterium]|jgi:ABC-type bacteriocin/lantibiotic exporter with double-glycine peptidase domain